MRYLLQGDDHDQDTEEEILKTVVDTNEDVEKSDLNNENVKSYPSPISCNLVTTQFDSDGLSSDSGFSDISADLGTSMQPTSFTWEHTRGQNTGVKTNLQNQEGEKTRESKIRILEKSNCSSSRWRQIFIFIIFLLIPLFIISNIKCVNNTCAIYISPHIRYYNTQHVI